jgi:hypothetical protein
MNKDEDLEEKEEEKEVFLGDAVGDEDEDDEPPRLRQLQRRLQPFVAPSVVSHTHRFSYNTAASLISGVMRQWLAMRQGLLSTLEWSLALSFEETVQSKQHSPMGGRMRTSRLSSISAVQQMDRLTHRAAPVDLLMLQGYRRHQRTPDEDNSVDNSTGPIKNGMTANTTQKELSLGAYLLEALGLSLAGLRLRKNGTAAGAVSTAGELSGTGVVVAVNGVGVRTDEEVLLALGWLVLRQQWRWKHQRLQQREQEREQLEENEEEEKEARVDGNDDDDDDEPPPPRQLQRERKKEAAVCTNINLVVLQAERYALLWCLIGASDDAAPLPKKRSQWMKLRRRKKVLSHFQRPLAKARANEESPGGDRSINRSVNKAWSGAIGTAMCCQVRTWGRTLQLTHGGDYSDGGTGVILDLQLSKAVVRMRGQGSSVADFRHVAGVVEAPILDLVVPRAGVSASNSNYSLASDDGLFRLALTGTADEIQAWRILLQAKTVRPKICLYHTAPKKRVRWGGVQVDRPPPHFDGR